MLSCTTDQYDQLYSRWLTGVGGLLDYAKWTPTDRVLDLCGGSGAVSKEILLRSWNPVVLKPQVTLLDLNPRCDDARVEQFQGRAEDLTRFGRRFTLIVCRQALGYLDLERLEEAVWESLDPGGRFVFNNFLDPRSKWELYKHEGQRFFEASLVWRDHVVHLQAGRAGVDLTHFRWHKHEQVLRTFLPRFEVEFIKRGRSVRYRCWRREC